MSRLTLLRFLRSSQHRPGPGRAAGARATGLSLLLGGLRERVARAGGRTKRIGVVSFVVVALALTATALIAPAEGDRQVDRFACRGRVADGGRRCAVAKSVVAARERAGWDCTTRGSTGHSRRSTSWECTGGSRAEVP
jgi:hypothetical protein